LRWPWARRRHTLRTSPASRRSIRIGSCAVGAREGGADEARSRVREARQGSAGPGGASEVDVRSLDKNGASLSAADRAQKQRDLAQLDTDFQRKQREFREDLNQRRNEELAAVLERANKVIKQIAEQQNTT
jgi:hypothetical protein